MGMLATSRFMVRRRPDIVVQRALLLRSKASRPFRDLCSAERSLWRRRIRTTPPIGQGLDSPGVKDYFICIDFLAVRSGQRAPTYREPRMLMTSS
jgi:hypothetical protein